MDQPILSNDVGQEWIGAEDSLTVKIGAAGPPLKIEKGWALIYHGVSAGRHYSLGMDLLGLEDPSRLVTLQEELILEPQLEWELKEHVPKVVFVCGQAILGDEIYIYYGGAEMVIGVASVKLEELGNL